MPSLPCIVIPRQTLAGNGGLGREVYLPADWRVQDFFGEDLRDEDFFDEDLRDEDFFDEDLRTTFLTTALRGDLRVADLRFGADILYWARKKFTTCAGSSLG